MFNKASLEVVYIRAIPGENPEKGLVFQLANVSKQFDKSESQHEV